MEQDILTISTGILVAMSCSLLGCFLILRKMVMVADAISHSVLPGIVLAYLLTTTRNQIPMLIGAAILGIFTTIIIEFFIKKAKIQKDASIGVTFTWLFAIGVLMLAIFTNGNVDIDQECILFGELGTVFLDKIYIDENLVIGTQSMITLLPLFIIVLLFIIFGFKGFSITSFNQEFADALGINSSKWNYLLMTLVSITTVFSFESVGAILVIGLLTIPPATAYLITTRLKKMLLLSSFIGIISVVFGYYLALYFNSSISGGIVVVSGCFLLITIGIVKIVKKISSKTKKNKIAI